MQTTSAKRIQSQRHLRAIIELIDGELAIFPIANSDADRAAILDALRFLANEQQDTEAA